MIHAPIMAEFFQRDASALNSQIRNFFAEVERALEPTCATFAQVQSEGGWPGTTEVNLHNLNVVAGRDLQKGATAEDSSVVQTDGQRVRHWVTQTLRERRLDECRLDEDLFWTLPSTRVAPFTESAPSTKGIMARPIVNLLVEPNA